MKNLIFFSLFIILLTSCSTDNEEIAKEVKCNQDTISIKHVYGTGETYCSFTSLVKRNDIYYLAFREGESHVSPEDYGVIRIMRSNNCEDWNLIQTIEKKEVDLRDPNLSIMPDGKILLVCGGRMLREDGNYETRTFSSVERNKEEWEIVEQAKLPQLSNSGICSWVWRITWNGDEGYGACYKSDLNTQSEITLLKTTDGKIFSFVSEIPLGAIPSETKLQFLNDGTCLAFLRCSYDKEYGFFAKSKPPYTEWNFKMLDIHIAGHDFIVDNGNQVVLVTRQSYFEGDKTCVFWGDLEGNVRWNYILPARKRGDDTGYAGIIDDGNRYVLSYYTMDTYPKPVIYVVKIPKTIVPVIN